MLEHKKILPPLWLAFPHIERFSIGWRMGSGEAYSMKWNSWYGTLSDKEQQEYRELFPEPATWKGYWDDEEACSYYENGDFFLELWQENGMPRYSLEQICREYSEGKKLSYVLFWGHHPNAKGKTTKSCLSQWWLSDFYSDITRYCCMEQFMMAKKAELFHDKDILSQILSSSNPKQIKSLGRKVKNFDEAVWDKVKYPIVLNGNYKKFSQNPSLRQFLLSTGDCILAEASPYDGIWGIQMAEEHADAHIPLKWQGSNMLGLALMDVRDELKTVYKNIALCDMSTINP